MLSECSFMTSSSMQGLTGASQSLQGAGSSIADAAARAAQQVGQAGAAAAGAAVGAAQGLQQRGADSAQKLQAAAVQVSSADNLHCHGQLASHVCYTSV